MYPVLEIVIEPVVSEVAQRTDRRRQSTYISASESCMQMKKMLLAKERRMRREKTSSVSRTRLVSSQ